MIQLWRVDVNATVLLFMCFYLGVFMRFFVRSVKAVRSPLRNYTTRFSFFKSNWDIFLIRTILFNTPLFVLWLYHPDVAVKFLLWLHVPEGIANWVIVPPTLLSAGGFGTIVDLAIDQVQVRIANNPPLWLPDQLKGEIPCYDSATVDVTKVADKRGSGD